MKAAPDLSVNSHCSLYLMQFRGILSLWFLLCCDKTIPPTCTYSVWMLWLVQVGEDDGQISKMYLNHVNLYERTCWDLKGATKLKFPPNLLINPLNKLIRNFAWFATLPQGPVDSRCPPLFNQSPLSFPPPAFRATEPQLQHSWFKFLSHCEFN